MPTIYFPLQQFLDEGLAVAVATIIATKGSVPRGVGTKMIVHPYGQHVGTVGGGCGEADVIRAALDVLTDGQPRTVIVDLTDAVSMQSLGVCGGVAHVFVERLVADGNQRTRVLPAVLASLDRRESVALVTAVAGDGGYGGQVGCHWVIWRDATRPPVGDLELGELAGRVQGDAQRALDERRHAVVQHATATGNVTLFIEVQAQPPHLIIAGAGHIAVPLAAMAHLCDFAVSVLDDRVQFANRQRFPTADHVLTGPFQQELRRLRNGSPTFDANTYVVLVTRGHQYDVECLLEILDDPVAYIGMIGSQRRIRAVYDLLEHEQGIAAAKFDRICAPVGIDIGAQTPAEIGVCIMAEIINVLRGGPAIALSEQIRRERVARYERVDGSNVA